MTSCLVLNHHSLPFDSIDAADRAVFDFLKIAIKAHNMGFPAILVDQSVDKYWFRLELTNNYFWQDWYEKNRDGENKDVVRAFRSIATQTPLFRENDIQDGVDLFDVRFAGGRSFPALRAAAWHDVPVTSFPTRSPWMTSPLRVEIDTLDVSGELVTRPYDILNFYSLRSFENEVNQLRKRRNALISSGKNLYEKRTALFPDIVFCGKVQQQLNTWSAGSGILEQVKESLTHLNTFCAQWKGGAFGNYSGEALRGLGLNNRVSGESWTVLNTPRLRQEREFWLPEGRKEIFENHIKLARGYRLHFFPDSNSKSIYVGYIGPHLKLS